MLNIFGPKIPQIDASAVKKAIDEKENFILLDVRTKEEYAKGKISGSINIPVDQVSEKISQTIPDKKSLVYVYCLSGSRSGSAVEIMQKLGYTNVQNMTSGLLAWRAKGYSLTQ